MARGRVGEECVLFRVWRNGTSDVREPLLLIFGNDITRGYTVFTIGVASPATWCSGMAVVVVCVALKCDKDEVYAVWGRAVCTEWVGDGTADLARGGEAGAVVLVVGLGLVGERDMRASLMATLAEVYQRYIRCSPWRCLSELLVSATSNSILPKRVQNWLTEWWWSF